MRKIIKKLVMILKKFFVSSNPFFDVRDTQLTEQELKELKELEDWIKNK
ncbi:MAG: hypothetical protein SPD90_13430 [Intestinibacter sp.]|nr:hypothetical protein [Intestinibacter sp.]MDY4576044.1 hypothetical protein [Intestinibacter sp.]